jgi:hypothetical protein
MAPSITDDGAAGAAAEKKAGVEREQTALEAISLGDTMPGQSCAVFARTFSN